MARVRAPRMPVRASDGDSAPERWLANIRLSSFTIMIMVLLVLGVIVLAPSLKLLVEQRQQIANLEKSVQLQKQQLAGLQTQVARWNDPAYIEAQARSRLLFVLPGQYSYLVVPNKTVADTTGNAPISTKLQTTKVDWVKSLESSIFTAGLSTDTTKKLESSNTIVSPQDGTSTSSGPSTSSGTGK